MIEHGETLLTWQLLQDPLENSHQPIPARRIGDHRKAYLTYEGPLTRNRGTVRRVEEGAVSFEKITGSEIALHLRGRHLDGTWILQATTQAEWTLKPDPS